MIIQLTDEDWLKKRWNILKSRQTLSRMAPYRRDKILDRMGRKSSSTPLPSGIHISANVKSEHLVRWSITVALPTEKTIKWMDKGNQYSICLASNNIGVLILFDIIDRYLDLSDWGQSEVFLSFDKSLPQKCKRIFETNIHLINNGSFDFFKNVEKAFKVNESIIHELMETNDSYTREATIRHLFTPYDYLWQSKKLYIEDARQYVSNLSDSKCQILTPIPGV